MCPAYWIYYPYIYSRQLGVGIFDAVDFVNYYTPKRIQLGSHLWHFEAFVCNSLIWSHGICFGVWLIF